jgi:hypothetical protein
MSAIIVKAVSAQTVNRLFIIVISFEELVSELRVLLTAVRITKSKPIPIMAPSK